MKFNTKKKTKEEVHAEILFKNTSAPDAELEEKDLHFGMFILGTEKHDSRRIDNQLRGRAGRQGDPGVSQFFVAMDDEIMRKMGGDKIQSIARMMLKTEELETIAFTQSQFTNSIARAQKQMEAWHFGIRKHLFDYDSVIDKQRTRIYAKRDQIAKTVGTTVQAEKIDETLVELDVIDEIKEFVREVVGSLVTSYTAMTPRQLIELTEELRQITGASFLEEELLAYTRSDSLQEALIGQVEQLFITRIAEVDRSVVVDICKRIYLAAIDKYRVAHIDEMHYLREKVGLYGYAQLDPLVIYKKEAFEKFQRLLFTIKKETLANTLRFDFVAHMNNQQAAVQLSEQVHAEVDMMAMLKAVTKGLKIEAVQPNTSLLSSSPKATLIDGQAAHVLSDDGTVEVIELDDSISQRDRGTGSLRTKLRPNDKVNVQYPDGKIAYGVKWKKVKEEVEEGKAKVL